MATPASQLLKGRYELLETLGSGGEARVVKALDHQHERLLALKIRAVGSERGREALLREARVLLGLPPHSALPLVREDFFEGEEYVVAMDWVDGTDLATLLRVRGTPGLAPSSVLAYLAEAAEALTFLHSQAPPIIHGDLKPGNLILTKGGHVKLVDFGLSSTLGMEGQRTGTVGFRAPELAAGMPPSRASDVFALAATAFALLTGAPPAGKLPIWQGVDPAQAEQLERALREGLATNPANRPPTPGEFVERLRSGWGSTLPTGVITFCMSDIVGSTLLWERNPRGMAQALVRHDELIAGAVESHGGRFLKSMGEGDSTVSVFDSAGSAVEAALVAARALQAEPWPDGLEIQTRWGLHTGEAERRGSDYFGPAVNLAARVRGEASGAEILLSGETAQVVRDQLPAGCSLVDLGSHRLKGVQAPERLYALAGAELPTALPADICPYRGLLPFEPADASFFFGREQVVMSLLGRLSAGRLLAVVGASGSGKSSLLRAGVIAAVQAEKSGAVRSTRLLTPMGEPPSSVEADENMLLVVDHFEELYTQCHDEKLRHAFIEALLSAKGPVVIAVRADFYGELSAHARLAEAVADNQVLVGPMGEDDLRRAVLEPARLAGLRLEPGLVDLILRDVGSEPGALPLMSHALRATCERRNGRTLTIQAYHDSGGVSSAVAQTADTVTSSLPAQGQQLLKNVFLRLTELGEGAEDTRRRVPVGELIPEGASSDAVRTMLDRLAEARLITLDENTAEVAHEILIRRWPKLREWLEEDREGIRLHRRLGDAARLWDRSGRHPADLYRGTRLDAATEWTNLNPGLLNEAEREFLDASLAETTRERRAQVRANRRLRRLVAGIGLLLMAAVGLTILALGSQQSAAHQRSIAHAQALALASQQQLSSDPVRALLLARAAEQTADVPQARLALRMALDADHLVAVLPSRDPTPCNGSDFLVALPGGSETAKSTCDGRVVFENLRARRVVRSVSIGHYGHGLALAPNGRALAVAVDQAVVILELATGRIVDHIALPIPVFAIGWDPTGRRLAFASPLGAIGWIDLRRRAIHLVAQTPGWRGAQWVSPQRIVFARAWTANAKLADTSGGLFYYRIGGPGLQPLLAASRGNRPYIGGEQLTSGRRFLFAAGTEGTGTSVDVEHAAAWIVDLRTGRVRSRSFALPGSVFFYSMSVLDGGRRMAVGDDEGQTLVLDVPRLRPVLKLGGASGYITGVAPADAGRELVTDSTGGSTRIYTLSVAERFRATVPGASVVYAHPGRLILPGTTYRIINLRSGAVGSTEPGYTTDLVNSPPIDEYGTSFVRRGRSGELDVVGLDGRVLCHCLSGPPSATGFFPLRSHRAGLLQISSPYELIRQLSVEDYRTHQLRVLARAPLSCSPHNTVTTPDSRYMMIDDQCGHGAIWDLRTRAVIGRFNVPSGVINAEVGLPQDRFAVGDFQGNTYLYDVHGREQFALIDGSSRVRGIDATTSGSLIATVSKDGVLRIWDGHTGDLMRRIDTGESLYSVRFSPDGGTVYTGTDQGLIEGFDTCPQCGNGRALLRASDALAVRSLSPAERQAFGVSG